MFALSNAGGSALVTAHIHVTTGLILAYSGGRAAPSCETFKRVHTVGQNKSEWVSKAHLFSTSPHLP